MVCGAHEAAFASRLAPTGDLRWMGILYPLEINVGASLLAKGPQEQYRSQIRQNGFNPSSSACSRVSPISLS
ncbi:hypothetical protein PS619_01230 [Pseudomonas fluorescens]|nr:hypothetical protein PS681_00437 [Pseudomonas fluorescens]VVM59795.1 hypothetical protein PS619_01230 [Pseudomonas fluorescens]VVN53001.1 hypothetical protein PS684_01205 [Pseudomonas fluorescens]